MQKTQKRVREEEGEFAPFALQLEKRMHESKGHGFQIELSRDCSLDGVTAMVKLNVVFARTVMTQVQLHTEHRIPNRDCHGCIMGDIIVEEQRGPCILGTFSRFAGGPDKYLILARATNEVIRGDQLKYNKLRNIFQDEADRAKDIQSCLTEELRDALNSSVEVCCVCHERTIRHTVCRHTLCIHCQVGVEHAHKSEPTYPCPICRALLVKTTPIVLDA